MKRLRLSAVFLIVVLLTSISFGVVEAQAPEIKIPNPTAEFYSNDFADILNSDTEQVIVSLGESLFKRTEGGQVVFVSIDTLDGNTIEEYSNALFNKWKIGTEDRGVLFILSMQEREIRIEVGYGYEGVLTDIQSYRLIEKFGQLNDDRGIDEAVKTIYNDICSIVSGDENIVQYSETDPDRNRSRGDNFFADNPIFTIFAAIIVIGLIILDFIFTGGQITFLILRMMAASSRRGGGGGGGGGRRNSGGGGRSGGGGASGRF